MLHGRATADGEARRVEQFNKERKRYLDRYKAANPSSGVTGGSKVNHKTPLDAGGCPVSDANLVPDPVLSGPCREIEDLQTKLQSL